MRVVPVNESVQIVDLSHDGRGIAKLNGKVVFIDGALPDEEVMFEYTKQKKKILMRVELPKLSKHLL